MTKPNPIEEIMVRSACISLRPDLKCKLPSCDCWQLKLMIVQQQLTALDNAGYVVVPRWQPPVYLLPASVTGPDINGGPLPPVEG